MAKDRPASVARANLPSLKATTQRPAISVGASATMGKGKGGPPVLVVSFAAPFSSIHATAHPPFGLRAISGLTP